ncbi:MAG: hypothetical protein KY444_00315, partial [Gemmatimonadetes bacterium]|nr:hypothetical protein [Gemmatimonadota bacterium]
MTRIAALVCAAAALACSPHAPAPQAEPGVVARDTRRGTVEIVGSEPMTSIVLQTAAGASPGLCGARDLLRRAAGLEVAVWGSRNAEGQFCVDRFAVRSANGVPAVDGILVREGQGFALVMADGRRLPIARLFDALRSSIGARVWLAGPLDRAPDSFGVIG